MNTNVKTIIESLEKSIDTKLAMGLDIAEELEQYNKFFEKNADNGMVNKYNGNIVKRTSVTIEQFAPVVGDGVRNTGYFVADTTDWVADKINELIHQGTNGLRTATEYIAGCSESLTHYIGQAIGGRPRVGKKEYTEEKIKTLTEEIVETDKLTFEGQTPEQYKAATKLLKLIAIATANKVKNCPSEILDLELNEIAKLDLETSAKYYSILRHNIEIAIEERKQQEVEKDTEEEQTLIVKGQTKEEFEASSELLRLRTFADVNKISYPEEIKSMSVNEIARLNPAISLEYSNSLRNIINTTLKQRKIQRDKEDAKAKERIEKIKKERESEELSKLETNWKQVNSDLNSLIMNIKKVTEINVPPSFKQVAENVQFDHTIPELKKQVDMNNTALNVLFNKFSEVLVCNLINDKSKLGSIINGNEELFNYLKSKLKLEDNEMNAAIQVLSVTKDKDGNIVVDDDNIAKLRESVAKHIANFVYTM